VLTELALQPASDVDNDELDQLTLQLRARLLDELDVNEAGSATAVGVVPDNAKSQSAVTLGTLVLALSPIALHSMAQVIQAWLKNRPLRSVKVTIAGDSIELSHATTSDQRRLVDSFVDRHSAS
jgi:hypothetical protein